MIGEFLFVVSLPPNASTKSKELRDAVTRSHAAKIGHKRTSKNRQSFSTRPAFDGQFITPASVTNAEIRLSGPRSQLSALKGSITLTEREKSALEEASEEQLAIWTGLDQRGRQKMLAGSPHTVELPLTLDLDHINTLCKDSETCVAKPHLNMF